MIETIKEFFQVAPYAAWSILFVLIILIFVSYAWESVKWWWLNTWNSFPVIGRIASSSKDFQLKDNGPWYASEWNLCGKYQEYVALMDENAFNEHKSYLALAQDNGRSNMSGWLWIVVIAMVFVEAMGFSYVLAGFTIPGASENLQQLGAIGVALLISLILLFATHAMGHELYKNSIKNTCDRLWNNDKTSNKPVNIRGETVKLSDPQDIDKGMPEYTRILNRGEITTLPSHKATILTVIFIVIIAIGATYVRGQVLEKMLNNEVVDKSEQVHLTSDGLDMGANVKLPSADKTQDKLASEEAFQGSVSNERRGGWATFIVLAFIFVGLQGLGIYFGFRWSFYGKESKDAYNKVGKYSTYADVRDRYNYVFGVAQTNLNELQKRMITNANRLQETVNPSKKFSDFLMEIRTDKEKDNVDQKSYTKKTVPAEAAQENPIEVPSSSFDAKEIAKKLNGFANKNEKLKFLEEAKLTETQQEQVAIILDEIKNKINSKLDGLL